MAFHFDTIEDFVADLQRQATQARQRADNARTKTVNRLELEKAAALESVIYVVQNSNLITDGTRLNFGPQDDEAAVSKIIAAQKREGGYHG